jgi:hypothetical protein
MRLYKQTSNAYLDIEQHPDIFESRLCKILEQIQKTRHLLVGFFQCPQLTYELIVAVYNLLVSAKTPLQVLVLRQSQSAINAPSSDRLT